MLAGCVSSGDPSAVQPIAVSGSEALAPLNAYRERNGLSPVTIDERLTRAAERQSREMAARDTMGHSVAGRLPARVEAVGYDWAAMAENLGRGYPSYASAMEGWIGSPSHRVNLLNERVTHVGVAAARDTRSGRLYWTQIFAAERPPRGEGGGDIAFRGAPFPLPSR